MTGYQGVLVCGEIAEDGPAPITAELLGMGRRLADQLGQSLSAALIGSGIAGTWSAECISFGADRVYVIDDPLLKQYLTDAYVAAMESLVGALHPDLLLFGQTSLGRDLAPRLAYRLNTGVTLDCIDLQIDSKTGMMRQTKPVYGGNAHAVYICRTKPQIASLRPKVMTAAGRDESRTGDIIPFDPDLESATIRGRVVKRVKEEVHGIGLEDADVVVCGGRGMGGSEGFQELETLARLLGGAVGATRPPCEQEWVPPHSQIGLTGKIVSPRLYIGVALSGSSQHLAGMSGSKNIVAVNKDPEANIFRVAHYGVVGDYRKILPAFIERCREER